MPLEVHIVTPEREVWTGEVQELIARGVDGEVGILGGHAPLLVQLAIGPLRMLTEGGETRRWSTAGSCTSRRTRARRAPTSWPRTPSSSDEIDVEAARARLAELDGRTIEDDDEVAKAEIAQGERADQARRLSGSAPGAGYHRPMDRFLVTGGPRLAGTVHVSGAKNSALKLMAASMLAAGRSVVTNVPRIRDCSVMAEMLEHLGVVGEARRRRRRARRDVDHAVSMRPMSSRSRCARRSSCSGRCSLDADARGSPCPAATTSAPGR